MWRWSNPTPVQIQKDDYIEKVMKQSTLYIPKNCVLSYALQLAQM